MTDEVQDTIVLSGPLTVREVPALAERHARAFHSASMPSSVDLSSLEGVDSSALALLLEWQARARDAGHRIRFDHPPDSLRVIARLTGVAPLLGWREDTDQEDVQKDSP